MEQPSLNRQAKRIVDQVIHDAEVLNVLVSRLQNGTTLIDMGQQVAGSWQAGLFYAEITMGGLGQARFETFKLDEYILPAVRVTSAHPLLVGWVSQKHADEPLTNDGLAPILTGPAKALLHPPDPSVVLAGYYDDSDVAVASFQTDRPITTDLATRVAERCCVDPENLYVVVAPTTSLACGIQVSARPIDQVMHRLHEEGLDIHSVRYAAGLAPVAPLSADELVAMGRINDALLYGGQIMLYVEGDDDQIAETIDRLPTQARPEYGRPFKEIFEAHDCDFHKMDLRLHSLALVQINNIRSGRSFSAGEINYDVLRRSFLG